MNKNKFIISFVVVFVVLEVLNFLIHGVLLSDSYTAEPLANAFRSEEEMQSKMWVMWVADLVWSFFFVFIFVRGYENKGIMEGLRYGIYIGLFIGFTVAYQSYVVYPITYGITFTWFITSLIISVILGILTSLIYKPAEAAEDS